MQIATVNSVRINVRQYTCANITAHGNNMVLSGIPGMFSALLQCVQACFQAFHIAGEPMTANT